MAAGCLYISRQLSNLPLPPHVGGVAGVQKCTGGQWTAAETPTHPTISGNKKIPRHYSICFPPAHQGDPIQALQLQIGL